MKRKPLTLDPRLLLAFNRGVENAIRYNRRRPEREDSQRWSANSRERKAAS